MKRISNNCNEINVDIFSKIEDKYSIVLRKDIKEFLSINSGGYPVKDIINVDEYEYEIRVFLSLDSSNQYYYIEKPLEYFLTKTKNKIIPIGIDSGDNYYCVNNDTGVVYYWFAEEDMYYRVAENLEEFSAQFE
jgi:hypothetical protein